MANKLARNWYIMGCGCGGGKKAKNEQPYDVMGGYKYLTDRQIKKRLEVFKRLHCKTCQVRYNCDFKMYEKCEVRPRKENKV